MTHCDARLVERQTYGPSYIMVEWVCALYPHRNSPHDWVEVTSWPDSGRIK